MPTPAFTNSVAISRASFFTYRTPSRMGEKSARSLARNGGADSRWGSLNLMDRISSADAINENEFRIKTAFRPNAAAITPPIADPIARLKLHVVEPRPFATSVSSGLQVIFGITELRPGSNSAQKRVSENNSRYKKG